LHFLHTITLSFLPSYITIIQFSALLLKILLQAGHFKVFSEITFLVFCNFAKTSFT
jgi:hypothetical protein